MKYRKTSRYRCLLLGGVRALAISLLLAIGIGCRGSRSTDTEVIQPMTTEVTSTECTTTSSQTTTGLKSTTSSTTTTSTTMTELMTVATTTTTVWVSTSQTETITQTSQAIATDLPITEQEYILISNMISHEAGGTGLTDYERSCIVAAIMNRVNDTRFPNNIHDVIYQPYQMFPVPYYRVDYYGIGFEALDRAIETYFSGIYDYGSINSWWGNGVKNFFYAI